MTSLADTAHLQIPAATASSGMPEAREVVPSSTPAREMRRHGVFLPVLLPGLALCAWLGLEAEQALTQRQQLQAQFVAQESALPGAQRVRAAADALAQSTQALADTGNPQAQLVIEELRRRGVTLKPAVPSR
jgi:hypothetical protein